MHRVRGPVIPEKLLRLGYKLADNTVTYYTLEKDGKTCMGYGNYRYHVSQTMPSSK